MILLPLPQHLNQNVFVRPMESDKQTLDWAYKAMKFHNAPFRLEDLANMVRKPENYGNSIAYITHKGQYEQNEGYLLFKGWEADFEPNATMLFTRIYSDNGLISLEQNGSGTGYEYTPIPNRENIEIKTTAPTTIGQFISDCFRAGIELTATPKAIAQLT